MDLTPSTTTMHMDRGIGANSVNFPVRTQGRSTMGSDYAAGGSAVVPLSRSVLELRRGASTSSAWDRPVRMPSASRRNVSPPPRSEPQHEQRLPSRVSLATWAGLEPAVASPGSFARPSTEAAVMRALDSQPPLLPPRLNPSAQWDSFGAVQDGMRTTGTTSQGSSVVARPPRQAFAYDNYVAGAQLDGGYPSAGDSYAASAQLHDGYPGAGGLPGTDLRWQQLQEARPVSPAPTRSRLNNGEVLYGPPATSSQAAYPLPFSNTSPAPYTEGPPRPLMSAGPLTIALDVDEVLCRYVDGFRKWLQRERPSGPLDTDSVFHEAHDPHSPWRLQFAMCGGLDNLEAVPGAVSALRKLRNAGLRLEVVTSRPPIMRESTEALLNKLFPPDTFAAAHFVGAGEKGRTCNAIQAVALVDDQIPNIIDAHACGVLSVLFNFSGSYPWAVCSPEELPVGVMRLETWAATSEYILAALRVNGGNASAPGDARAPSPLAGGFRRQVVGDYRAPSPSPPDARRQMAGSEWRAPSPSHARAQTTGSELRATSPRLPESRAFAGDWRAPSPTPADGRRRVGGLLLGTEELPAQAPQRTLAIGTVQQGVLEAPSTQQFMRVASTQMSGMEGQLPAYTFEDRPPIFAAQPRPPGGEAHARAVSPTRARTPQPSTPTGGVHPAAAKGRPNKWMDAFQSTQPPPGMMQPRDPMYGVGAGDRGLDDGQASCAVS